MQARTATEKVCRMTMEEHSWTWPEKSSQSMVTTKKWYGGEKAVPISPKISSNQDASLTDLGCSRFSLPFAM